MEQYYEESMPVVSTNNDYMKYFIDESLSLFDKLNMLIKKGEPFQHQAMLTNLSIYSSNMGVFTNLINFIITNIEMWELPTQMCFPKGLYDIITKINFSNYTGLFNVIIKHILYSISTFEESVSAVYVNYFNMIIDNLINRKLMMNINPEVYEFVISLGKFGQVPKNRKFCAYFCSSISRIDAKKNQSLYNRFIVLCGDTENSVKMQIAYEFRYIITLFYDTNEEYSELGKNLISYINYDTEHIVQTEAICSVLKNIGKISTNKEITKTLIEKMKRIVNDATYENNLVSKVIKECFDSLVKEKKGDISIYLSSFINLLIDNEIFSDYLKRCEGVVNTLYGMSDDNNDDNSIDQIATSNEEAIITLLRVFIESYNNVANIFDELSENREVKEIKCNIYKLITNNTLFKKSENYCNLFYQNLHKIIPFLTKETVNSLIKEKRESESNFLSKKNIKRILNRNCEEIVLSMSTKNKIPLLSPFINNFQQINLNSLEPKEERFLPGLMGSIKAAIPLIYTSSALALRKEDLFKKISTIAQDILSRNKGYHISSAAISIYAHLIKYSKNRDDYLRYLRQNFGIEKSFYFRRLMAVFIKECFVSLSVKFIIEKKIFGDFIAGINDKVPSLASSYILYTINIYSYLKVNKVATTVINQIKEKKILDEEMKRCVEKVLNFVLSQEEKMDGIIEEIDNKKYLSETEIKNKETEKLQFNLISSSKNQNEEFFLPSRTQSNKSLHRVMHSHLKSSKYLAPVGTNIKHTKSMHSNTNLNNKENDFPEVVNYSNLGRSKALNYKANTFSFNKFTGTKKSFFPSLCEGSKNTCLRPSTRGLKKGFLFVNNNSASLNGNIFTVKRKSSLKLSLQPQNKI